MVLVSDVFKTAMGLMDELSKSGSAQTVDTDEYKYRTPSAINIMVAELKMLVGDREDWLPISSIGDIVPNVSTSYGIGVMPYGLAANLLIDENPTAANFYQQRYEEMRNNFLRRQTATFEDIKDVYGGVGYGEFSRW